MTDCPENINRNRWYGIRKGDIVSGTFGGKTFVGEVIHLYAMDNNRVRIKDIEGIESDWCPEWCKIITRVEDRYMNKTQNKEVLKTKDRALMLIQKMTDITLTEEENNEGKLVLTIQGNYNETST